METKNKNAIFFTNNSHHSSILTFLQHLKRKGDGDTTKKKLKLSKNFSCDVI